MKEIKESIDITSGLKEDVTEIGLADHERHARWVHVPGSSMYNSTLACEICNSHMKNTTESTKEE